MTPTRDWPSRVWAELRGRPIHTFLLCLVGMTLSTADQALFSYAMPAILREFEIGLDVIGLLLSASFAVAAFTVVIAGMITDRLGRVRVFVILLAASATCVGLHALAGNLGTLATLRILGFALAAGMYPITNTIVIEATPARYRGLLAGLLQLGYPLGFFVGSLFASPMLEAFGWRSIFLPAFLVILVAFWIGRNLSEPSAFVTLRDARAGAGESAAVPLRLSMLLSGKWRARALICLSGSAVMSVAIGSFTFFIPTFLTEAKGLSDSAAVALAGWTYLIGAVGYVVSAYVGEFLMTRRNTLILWIWVGGLVFAAAIWLASSPLALTVLLGLTVMFLFGSEAVRMPLVGEMFPTELRATATAATGSVGVTIGLLLAPLLIGALVPAIGWLWTFTLIAVLPLLGAGLLFLLLENRRSGEQLVDLFDGCLVPEAAPTRPAGM